MYHHDWITFLILEKSYKNCAIIIIILCITAPKIVLWKFNIPKEVKLMNRVSDEYLVSDLKET